MTKTDPPLPCAICICFLHSTSPTGPLPTETSENHPTPPTFKKPLKLRAP